MKDKFDLDKVYEITGDQIQRLCDLCQVLYGEQRVSWEYQRDLAKKLELVIENFDEKQEEKTNHQKPSPGADCEFDLKITEDLVAPKDLTLSGQALWYQEKLEELSPLWQYTKFVHDQVQSAWVILHGKKHDCERKLVDVKVLKPAVGKGNGKKRGPKATGKGFADQIRALPISDAEKKKLAALINVEI